MPYIRYTYQYISGAKLSGRRARNLPILMNTGLTEYEIVFVLQTHLQNQVFWQKTDDLSSTCLAKGLSLLNGRFSGDQIIMSF
jgi:hypothetical protein